MQPRHVYSHDDVSIYQHIVHTFTIHLQVVAFQLPSISNRHFKKRQPFLQILVLIAYFRVPDRSRSPNPKAKALTQSPARSEWFWNRMKSNYCMDQGVCEGENALSARIFVSPRAAQNNFCIGKTQSQNDIINFAAPDWSNHGIRAATEKIYKSVLALTFFSRGEKIKHIGQTADARLQECWLYTSGSPGAATMPA